MHIQRAVKQDIQKKLQQKKSKILIIYGARQTGKTSLAEEILKGSNKKILKLSGDEAKTADIFAGRSLEKLKMIVSGCDLLFLDEAQRIENIGLNLKILHDHCPQLKMIVTGSSSFDLASSIQEPLTGRSWVYHLHPMAMCELKKHFNSYELLQKKENLLVFGSYPEVFSIRSLSEKKEYLHTLVENYLYKDMLTMEGIKAGRKIKKLLQLLAFQIGSEVSLTELSTQMEVSKNTVERYLDLLEKFFVIFRLNSFRRNLRKELSQKPKIYFCDLGMRNAVISHFNSLEKRNDLGQLWGNWLILERLKLNTYLKTFVSPYFWRTYTGAELDYVEEQKGKLHGYEIKWSKTSKAPASWKNTYHAAFTCLNKDNFLPFVLEPGGAKKK